jgi:hypothetical protein
MQLNLPWEAANPSTIKEIRHILWKPKQQPATSPYPEPN